MSDSRRTVDLPRLLEVGEGCVERIAALLGDHAFELRRAHVGSSGDASSAIAQQVVAGLEECGCGVTHSLELNGGIEEALELAGEMVQDETTVAIAVGGGRVIDTVKLASARAGVELVSIPTAISHDGVSSPVASLFAEDGRRRSHAAVMPAGIIVDIGVIGGAPPRTFRAGLGDLLSNLTAILDWRLAQAVGSDRFDAYSAMIAENAARSVLDLEELESAQSHERLAEGLLMSGLAMAAAGTSRPCSGAEHLISHALDELLGEQAAMHGEQVALGTLVSAAAHDTPLRPALVDLYSRLELPMHPSQLSISDDDMVRAVLEAPQTRPDRYTILSERTLSTADVIRLLDDTFASVA